MKERISAASLAFFALLAGVSLSQEQKPGAPPPAQAKESFSPGLTLRLESGGQEDVRDARLASLRVPEGTPPSSFVPPGPFKATWEGFISVDLGTDCTFSAVGNGAVTVTIGTKTALEAHGPDLSTAQGPSLRLRKGRNKLVIAYQSPPAGEAFLRLSWASSDFAREPIPPLALSHDVKAPALLLHRRLREGRELLAARHCLKCHAGAPAGMPELAMDAPSLAEAGARLGADWMARWIQNPRAMRPRATMPKLPHLEPQDAADMAAYLSTLGTPEPDPAFPPEAAKRGGELLAEMRCVGCHTLPGKDPTEDRIPLGWVKAKWKPAALKKFLLAPERHYAWIEMPNFHLKDEEATALAAFLLSRPAQAAVEPSGLKGDPARGRHEVESRGCMKCHTVTGTTSYQAPALAQLPADHWAGGCKGADFGLSPAQTEAIAAFAATDRSSLGREALPEFAERQIAALRCFACHRRDDRQDAWSDYAAEAREFEPPKKADDGEFATVAPAEPWFPSLTWVGEKLKPEWAVAFLKGEVKERPRPYLKNLRMPSFPARAEGLVHGLSLEHGYPTSSAPEPEPNPELAELGRKLSGPAGGLDCLSCHSIGPKGATKVFEAPAPNFKLCRDRIRKDYYDRWVREPLRLEPGTKMPQFIKDGRTQLTEILEGDGVRQADALWQYLLEGDRIRPPQ